MPRRLLINCTSTCGVCSCDTTMILLTPAASSASISACTAGMTALVMTLPGEVMKGISSVVAPTIP